MVKWKCPNCKREKETEKDKVMVLCACSYVMEIFKVGNDEQGERKNDK